MYQESIGLLRHYMEKGTARLHASGFNRSMALGSMDLLSLTFRSLDLAESAQKQEDPEIQESDHLQCEENSKARRRIKSNKNKENLNIISLNEVAWHDTPDNCWIVIYDYVYDCTDFLSSHPGGQDVLLEYAGRDATLAFIGFGHPKSARQSLDKYLIGELPPEERIFRIPGGVKVIGF